MSLHTLITGLAFYTLEFAAVMRMQMRHTRTALKFLLSLWLLSFSLAQAALPTARIRIDVTLTPSTLTAGKPYTLSWAITNSTNADLYCSNAGPTRGNIGASGSVSGTADPSWVTTPPNCSIAAQNGPDQDMSTSFSMPTAPSNEPVNGAVVVAQNIPSSMVEGQYYPVSITMRNSGTTTWTSGESYRLGESYGTAWGVGRVELASPVGPGQQYTFSFNVRAPAAGSQAGSFRMLREGVEWFGETTSSPTFIVARSNQAQIMAQSAPAEMITGSSYSVSVTVKNTGNVTWEPSANYRLGSQNPQDNGTWGFGRVNLPVPVPPNGDYTFTFNVVAPVPGSYNQQWKMVQDGVQWFGATASMPVIVKPVPPVYNTVIVSQTAAAEMVTGQSYPVSVRVRNTGNTTWEPSAGYALGSQNPQDNSIWELNRVALATPIPPNGEYTFTFNVTAPAPASYNMQWRMLNSGGYFGATAGMAVTVKPVPLVNNAVVLTQSAPAEMVSGQTYPVRVTVRNTGTTTWDTGYTLGSMNPQNNSLWGLTRVALANAVPPNGEYTFTFNVTAPAAGSYNMQWRVLSQVEWFGGTASMPVTVVNPAPPGSTGSYDGAMGKTNYKVYSGDVNGDGRDDILMKASPKIVMIPIDDDLMIPISIPPSSPSFVLLSSPTGNYSLSSNPDAQTLAFAWKEAQYALTFSGATAGVADSVSIRALNSDQPPFVVSMGSGTGQLWLASAPPPTLTSSSTPVAVAIAPPHLTNPNAGTLPGSLDVSRNGAATYSIAIEVPPGTNTVQPALSLNYDGQSPNGPLGLGWSLGGMSSIHRCGKTIDQDGVNDRISFSNSDRLCLDGQRLVLVNRAVSDDNYWAAEAEYRTEIESFTRITSSNGGPGGALSFKVETKDGRISSYGTGSGQVKAIVGAVNSGVGGSQPAAKNGPQSWAIDKTQDRVGNHISYSYEQDQTTGEHRPTFIRYGGAGLAPHAAVQFVHEARPDAWKRYVDESRNDLRMRISRMRTYVGNDLSGDVAATGTLVRDYALTYEQSPTSGRSMLRSAKLCARHPDTGGLDCLPETTFNWGKPSASKTPGFVSRGLWSGAPILTTYNTAGGRLRGANHADYFAFSDFNLDGRADVLEKRVASVVTPDLDTYEGASREASNPIRPGTVRTQYRYFHNTGAGFSTHTYQLNTLESFVTLDVGDFNGDGALDLFVVANDYPKICLSPLGANSGTPGAVITFDCGNALPLAWRNSSGRSAYIFDPLGDGRSAAYSTKGNDGWATFCTISTCLTDQNPPLVIGVDDRNMIVDRYDGSPENKAREYITFNQMVDFAGNGKPFDVRWTAPYFEQFTYDGTEQVPSNTWHNPNGQVAITGLGWPGQATSVVASYNYPYPSTGTGYTGTLRAYYDFDKPYQGNALSADFNGSGYASLMFGYIEIGWDGNAQPYNKKAETTLCLSTGRALDCSVRLKYSGSEYRAVRAVGDFVGDGAPAVLVSPLVAQPNGARPMPSSAVQMCRVTGDDPTGGHTASDTTMSCTAWPGLALPEDLPGALTNQVYFMDLLGNGRTQLVYYHSGDYVNGVWQEDGRWEVFESIDVAEDGQALDRLVSVTNGLGATSSVEYKDGLSTGVVGSSETASYQYPVQKSKPAGKIVHQITTSNGVGNAQRTSYQYRDAATHVAGRGSLGFATVIETDLETNFVTTSRYAQDWPRIGVELGATTVSGTCTVSKVDNEILVKTFAQGNGVLTRQPYTRSNTVTRRDIDPNCSELGTVTTVSGLDDWGNANNSVVTSRDSAETFVTTTDTMYRNDAPRWLLGLPTHVTVKKTSSTSTASPVRTMDYDYDADTGLLKQEIVEKGDLQYQVITDYLRDGNPFGLVSKKMQTWHDAVKVASRTRTVAEMTYDAKGRYPATVKNALGHTETHTHYPETGARKSIKDPNLLTTSWVADGFGRTVKELRADGNETRSYMKACQGDCPAGAVLAQITDTFNGSARITVPQVQYSDSAGHVLRRLTWGFDGRAIVTDQRFDARGRLSEKDWPRFDNAAAYIDSRMFYDNLDRVTETVRTDEAGVARSSLTTHKGLTTELTNARGFKRIEKRNVLGQVRSVIDPNNKTTSIEYEPFGGLGKTTDPNLNVVRVEYDRLGRKTELHDPDLGHIIYTVDPLGRVITQESPNQRIKLRATGNRNELTHSSYDDLDRITERLEPDLKSYWIFDTAVQGIGRLAEAYTKTGTVTDYRRVHAYDNLGRPGTTTQTLTDGTYTSTPTYDAWGRVITQTHRRNADPAKKFDSRYQNGYLARVERGSLVLWKVNAQDAGQRPTSIALGNGLTQSRVFDPRTERMTSGALSTASAVSRLQEGYEYDALGNVSKRQQYWDQGGFQESFEYDALNRLGKSDVLGQGVQNFRYDDVGNLLSKTGVGTGDYNYGEQGVGKVRPHAVKHIPGIGSFDYDDNGNLTSGAGRSMTWTSFDMPNKMSSADASANFKYGPEHQRVYQSRGDGSGVVYAGAQEVEKNASGTIIKTYWPNGIGVEIDRSNTNTSELYWHHLDRLGSVIGLTDQAGLLKDKLAYDAWGKRRKVDDNSTPNRLDNRGYTGHEMLDQLELVHMNGRVYDPLVARFVSGDPLIQDPVDGQNYNRYSYVLNNPTNNTDPTGFECETMTGSKICGVDSGAKCSGNCTSGMPGGNSKEKEETKGKTKKEKNDAKAGNNPAGRKNEAPANNGYADSKAGTATNGGGLAALFGEVKERFMSVVTGKGLPATEKERATWLAGLREAEQQGKGEEYVRRNPLPGFGLAANILMAGAGSGKIVVGAAAAKLAASSLAKSSQEMVTANAAHIFAKGRFSSIGSQQEVTVGIGGAMGRSHGGLVEGNNTIMTVINNQNVTIRARMQDGALSNINAFPGTSTRAMGNVIDLR